jgi:rubrerythrin
MTDVTLTKLTCTRCGHQWYPRHPYPPKVCPVCKRTAWQETGTGGGEKV